MSTLKAKRTFWPQAHRISWIVIIVTWLIWLLNSFDYMVVFSVGPIIIEEFGLTAAKWGLILAFLNLLRAVAAVPTSIYSDRLGSGWRRKYFWVPAIILYSICGAACIFRSISGSLAGLVALRSGVQIGTGADETVGVAATSEWWAKEHQGFAIGLHHTGFPLGGLLAGLLVTWHLTSFGVDNWRWVFIWTLLSIPLALYWWKMANEKNMNKVYLHMDKGGLHRPHSGEVVEGRASLKTFFKSLKNRNILICAINSGIFMGVWTLWMAIYPNFLHQVHKFDYAHVAALSVVWTITGAAFQFLIPWLSDFVGRRNLLIISAFHQALVFLLMPYAGTLFLIIGIQVFYGLTLNAVYPMLYTMSAESAEEGGVATAVSVAMIGMFLAAAVVPYLLTPVIDMFGGWASVQGYYYLFYIMAGLLAIAGILQAFGTKETAIRVLEKKGIKVTA